MISVTTEHACLVTSVSTVNYRNRHFNMRTIFEISGEKYWLFALDVSLSNNWYNSTWQVHGVLDCWYKIIGQIQALERQSAQRKKVKTFPSHVGPLDGAHLRFNNRHHSARHQLTLRDHGYGLVYRAVCLQPSMVLIASTHRGMARLSWPGWLAIHLDGLLARRRLPTLVLTGPGVSQLRWSRPTPYH